MGRTWTVLSLALTLLVMTAGAQAPPPQMEAYYVGLFRRGPTWTAEKTSATAEVQQGHLASTEKRWREGTLLGSGPLLDNGDVRGILIIKAASDAAARAVADDDPAVAAGRLVVDPRRRTA